jgi:hypothetical protein
MFGCAFTVVFFPKGHRIQRLLIPLTRRLGATVAAIVLAVPVHYAIGADAICWTIMLGVVGLYWWQFISEDLLGQPVTFKWNRAPARPPAAPPSAEIEAQY